MKIDNLERAFNELLEAVADLPGGDDYLGDGFDVDLANEELEYIKAIPDEWAPVVHAHWISAPVYGNDIASGVLDDDEFLKHYRCSRCGRRVSCLAGKNPSKELPYCHCGAKMDEKEDTSHEEG